MLLKVVLIIIIVSSSILAITGQIPAVLLNRLVILLAVAPLILIFFKRHLLTGLLLWLYFLMFRSGLYKYGATTLVLPVLPDLSPERISWLCIFTVFIFELVWHQRKVAAFTSVEIGMIFMCLYIMYSMMVADTIYEKGKGLTLNFFLSNYFFPFSAFFLAKNIVDDEQKVRRTFIFVTIIGFYLGLTGIFENFGLWRLVFPRYIAGESLGMNFGQARGPFLSAGENGLVLSMIFFIAVCLYINTSNKWMKFFLSVTTVLVLLAILFTYQRTVWLGFLVASLTSLIFLPQARKIVLIIVIAAMLVSVIVKFGFVNSKMMEQRTGAVNSIYGRINLYATAKTMFLEKPLFGFGFNAYKKHNVKYIRALKGVPYSGVMSEKESMHDAWALILVELGLVGFAGMWFIFLAILIKSIRLYLMLPVKGLSGKTIVAAFWGAFIVLLITMEFTGWAGSIFPVSFFFLLAGIIVGMYQRICQGEGAPQKI